MEVVTKEEGIPIAKDTEKRNCVTTTGNNVKCGDGAEHGSGTSGQLNRKVKRQNPPVKPSVVVWRNGVLEQRKAVGSFWRLGGNGFGQGNNTEWGQACWHGQGYCLDALRR